MSSYQWADFLQLAEVLAVEEKAAPNESRRRTVISRAYYATYHAARVYAATVHGITVKATEGSVHTELWAELSAQSGKVPKLAIQGKQLLTLRKHADYEATPPISDAQMNQSLMAAKLAAQLLAEFQKPSGTASN